LKPLKVVIVDDSEIITERLQEVLNAIEGIECLVSVPYVPSALAFIAESNPQVVILDIHLKGDSHKSNGICMLMLLRKKYPEMKLFLFTNFADEHYRKSYMGFGADFVFDKSHDLDKVIDAISILRQTN
jgi:DNA-binding NarL/FixJ family response regulator